MGMFSIESSGMAFCTSGPCYLAAFRSSLSNQSVPRSSGWFLSFYHNFSSNLSRHRFYDFSPFSSISLSGAAAILAYVVQYVPLRRSLAFRRSVLFTLAVLARASEILRPVCRTSSRDARCLSRWPNALISNNAKYNFRAT